MPLKKGPHEAAAFYAISLLSDLYGMRNMIIIAGLVMLSSVPLASGLGSRERRKAYRR
ncbi:MAG: hypothetical protein HYX24_01365 [Candidatus Aenigmarchaeota archaeon]|nr:hypothetical protein [Candidatus Aenigmarchaeota archaeon]